MQSLRFDRLTMRTGTAPILKATPCRSHIASRHGRVADEAGHATPVRMDRPATAPSNASALMLQPLAVSEASRSAIAGMVSAATFAKAKRR